MHGSHGAYTAVKYPQDTNKYRALQISNQILYASGAQVFRFRGLLYRL
jgi:conjugal transfer/entry exclusion protein